MSPVTGSAAAGWGPQEWAAASGLALGLIGSVGAGLLHASRVSYRLGRADEEPAQLKERLGKLEGRAEGAEARMSAVKVLQGALEALKEQVIELRHDLKHLMRGTEARRDER